MMFGQNFAKLEAQAPEGDELGNFLTTDRAASQTSFNKATPLTPSLQLP